MRRPLPALLAFVFLIALSACAPSHVVEFWRPISEPNIMMPTDRAQMKLDFDLSQCGCGVFPTNVVQGDLVAFQPDAQRYAQTSVTTTADEETGECMQHPSLVVAECMRTRGWEVTKCSGRMPLPGGGAMCAAATY